MKNKFKRLTAVFLVVALCFGTVPFSVFAAESPGYSAGEVASEPDMPPPVESAPESEVESVPSSLPENPVDGTESSQTESTLPENVVSEGEVPTDTNPPESSTELWQENLDGGQVAQVWPVRRTRAVGQGGSLRILNYCFTSSVGNLPTMGSVERLPAKAVHMSTNEYKAAYCLQHDLAAINGCKTILREGGAELRPFSFLDRRFIYGKE